MKQKVMIICAFIVNPELYIIDEPFLGLDPLGIQSMLDLMVEKKNEGRTDNKCAYNHYFLFHAF
jgi:ABC-2 type transport system ATP-binding protein